MPLPLLPQRNLPPAQRAAAYASLWVKSNTRCCMDSTTQHACCQFRASAVISLSGHMTTLHKDCTSATEYLYYSALHRRRDPTMLTTSLPYAPISRLIARLLPLLGGAATGPSPHGVLNLLTRTANQHPRPGSSSATLPGFPAADMRRSLSASGIMAKEVAIVFTFSLQSLHSAHKMLGREEPVIGSLTGDASVP